MNGDKVSLCGTCGELGTYRTNGDCDWCNECHSVEPEWKFLELYTDTVDVTEFIDEEGDVYDEDYSFVRNAIESGELDKGFEI